MADMDDLTGSIMAGVAAAIVATAILGIARWIRAWWRRYGDIKQIREIVKTGRERVVRAKGFFHEGMQCDVPANVIRCGQYNLMIKQLAVLLDHRTSNLPYGERKQIHDALDWFHTDALSVIKDAHGHPTIVSPPEGTWPTRDMRMDHAKIRFDNLQTIGWLKLGPYEESS